MSKKAKYKQLEDLEIIKERSKNYNTCTSCKDTHEVGSMKGEYLCPNCGWNLIIK